MQDYFSIDQSVVPNAQTFTVLLKLYLEEVLLKLHACLVLLEEEDAFLNYDFSRYSITKYLTLLPSRILSKLLLTPFTSNWVLQCSKLICQPKSEQRQEKLLSHLIQWNTLLMSVAIEAATPLQVKLVADSNGLINLPLSGYILRLPSDWASTVLECQYNPSKQQLVLRNAGQVLELQLSCASFDNVIFLSKVYNFMTIDNLDIIYHAADKVGYQYQDFNKQNLDSWKSAFEKSLNCIANVSEDLIFEIKTLISVAVPVVSSQPDIHLSSSSAEIIGSFYISYSEDEFILSEAIVHEYYHNKLNVILYLDNILVDDLKDKKYFSPWRKDARPLIGLLHACFSFWGVTSYWGKYLKIQGTSEILEEVSKDRLKNRLEQLLVQLDVGLSILERNANFTTEGEKLVKALLEGVKSLKVKLQHEYNLSYKQATERLLVDMQEWEVRNQLKM